MNRRCLVVFLIGVLVATAVAAAADSRSITRASKMTNRAIRALETGDVDKAVEQFESALEQVPGYPEAHIGLGQIAMSQRRFGDALEHFEQARDGYAVLGAALHDIETRRYAQSQRRIIQLREAIDQLSSQVVKDTRAQQRILALENEIARQEAIQPPAEGEAYEPSGEVFFYIGNAQFQLGDLAGATTSWETCAERSPRFAMVHNNLALVYWKRGELDRALESLDRAEELGFSVNPKFRADLEAEAE